ncbi:MAG: hypothetical protein WB789_06270 [Thermoplasmata archaeon]
MLDGGPGLARRVDWTTQEWTIAWDACPKEKQSYGQTDRNVVEVADLIDRTPSAVSRAFGNLWGAKTNGKKGLRNFAGAALAVVEQYGTDYDSLHREAAGFRRELVRDSLTPRIDIESPNNEGVLPDTEIRSALRHLRLTRPYYFIYHRVGSLSQGIGFVSEHSFEIGAGLIQLVKWIDERVRRKERTVPEAEVTRSRAWVRFREGKVESVEVETLHRRLPNFHSNELGAEGREQLASFLVFIKGLREVKSSDQSETSRPRHVARDHSRKVRRITRLLRVPVTHLCPDCIDQLDRLLRQAESPGFRKAVREFRQRKRTTSVVAGQLTLDSWEP